MNSFHRSKIATTLIFCLLLVIPVAVPAFASAHAGRAHEKASASQSTVADPPADPTADTGAPDPTESTGSTGSTGPSGPVAGGGVEEPPASSGDTPSSNPAPSAPPTDAGAQPPTGKTEIGKAPRSTGTVKKGGSSKQTSKPSGGNSGNRAAEATGTDQLVNSLRSGDTSSLTARGSARDVAGRATDTIQRNAESGVVASMVVTRIISKVPSWVFWALGGLALMALSGLALFLRERRRRRSAEIDAMVDELTGIANRKAFDRRLDLEWRRAVRYGRSLGLMVMDLDGFKQINDLKGHAAGDQVLHDVAQALHRRMRDTDLVARIGGDEFAVICPETGINELMTIRRQLGEQTTREVKETVGLSIGVAEYVPSDDDATSILARADESMYRVKRGEATALPA
jgi:diguanylate cyclase (GGDEF)-like protein